MASYKYLILGGGMVAGYAAKEFVERGLRPGELGIVSSDDTLPYERPPLSKGYLAGEQEVESILINPGTFYGEHGIDVRLLTVVRGLDFKKKSLTTATGDELGFEKLLLATGARARTFPGPGHRPQALFYLRSLEDARRIRERAQRARRVVVIGGGFIGMEAASVLARREIETVLAMREERVWKQFFTPEMSDFFEKYYEARGVKLRRNAGIAWISEEGGGVQMKLDSGEQLAADFAVAGIGATPVTELFEGTGLQLDRGVRVNEYLETGVPDVWAAGDVTRYLDVLFQRMRHVEHWDNAVEQGRHAAGSLMGERKAFVHVPYFFSDVFDLSYEFWGDTSDADRVVYRGQVARGEFSVWWLKDQRLRAAFVMRRPDTERTRATHLIESQEEVDAAEL
jgi:NADPH-dependent 2,4-dienoyl-CoA reductase/sulfur reductase-like enzyme